MTSICVVLNSRGDGAVLIRPYKACVKGLCFTVPAKFKTDFASTPRWLWWWIPPVGKYAGAALIHDYLYSKRLYSRRICDAIFLDLMQQAKVPKVKRFAMWAAVRLFGGGHFK